MLFEISPPSRTNVLICVFLEEFYFRNNWLFFILIIKYNFFNDILRKIFVPLNMVLLAQQIFFGSKKRSTM